MIVKSYNSHWVVAYMLVVYQKSHCQSKMLLAPSVVVAQLIQHPMFLKAALPGLDDDELQSSVSESKDPMAMYWNFDVPQFSVFVQSIPVQHDGLVAVILAMVIGALVDAEEAS